MNREYVLGIDLGGTKVEVCLLDMERRLLARCREPSGADRGLDHVIDTIMGLAGKAAAGRTVVAAGVGTPGTYEREGDRLRGAPHTPIYETPGFIGRLKERLNVPTVVENDANCLALAEFFTSCAGRFHCVMAVILGTCLDPLKLFFRNPTDHFIGKLNFHPIKFFTLYPYFGAFVNFEHG